MGATLTGTVVNEVLFGVGQITNEVTYVKWFLFAFPLSVAAFVIAYGVLWVQYCKGMKLRATTNEIIQDEYDELIKEIGPFSRDELFVGLLQILQFALLILQPQIGRAAMSPYGEVLISDPTLAIMPAVLLFFIPSVVRPGQALLTWPSVHDKFEFGLILLCGGGFAISQGFTESGLNVAIGTGVAAAAVHLSPFLMNITIVAVCVVSTQIFSNVAAASTLLPALYSASHSAVYNPVALVLPAAIACSFGFLLPTATPANVIALAKSQDLSRPLRVRDFLWSGAPLTLLLIVVGALVSYGMGQVVFDMHGPFPQWACQQGVSCLWLPIPGVVNGGQHVLGQACMLVVQNESSMEHCMLFNGTVINDTPFMTSLPMQ